MNINSAKTKNIYHLLKRQIVNPKTIEGGLSEAECRLGALPRDFLMNLSEEEIPAVTEKIDKLFSEYGKNLRSITSDYDFVEYLFARPYTKVLEEDLKRLLKREDIVVSRTGSGAFKQCTQIKLGERSYALSTFRQFTQADLSASVSPFHGNEYEPTAVFNLYKTSSQGRLARPFMTRIKNDEEGGEYMLSKFIEGSHPVKVVKGPISASREKTVYVDARDHNSVNGVIIDVGGLKKNKRHIEDKALNLSWRDSASSIDAYIAALNEYRGPECQAFLERKIKEGVDILDDKNYEQLCREFASTYSVRKMYMNAETAAEGIVLGLFGITKKMPKAHKYVQEKLIPNVKHVDRFGNKEPLDEYMDKCSKDAKKRLNRLLKQYRKMSEMKARMMEEGTWDEMQAMLADDFKEADFGFTQNPKMCEEYIPTMMMKLLGIKEIRFDNRGLMYNIEDKSTRATAVIRPDEKLKELDANMLRHMENH